MKIHYFLLGFLCLAGPALATDNGTEPSEVSTFNLPPGTSGDLRQRGLKALQAAKVAVAERNLLNVSEGQTLEQELEFIDNALKTIDQSGWMTLLNPSAEPASIVTTRTRTDESFAQNRDGLVTAALIRRETLREELQAPLFLRVPLGEEAYALEGGPKTQMIYDNQEVTLVIQEQHFTHTLIMSSIGRVHGSETKRNKESKRELDAALNAAGLLNADREGIPGLRMAARYEKIVNRFPKPELDGRELLARLRKIMEAANTAYSAMTIGACAAELSDSRPL